MLNTPPKPETVKKIMRKHTSPHDRHFFPFFVGSISPKGEWILYRTRPAARWERRTFCFIARRLYHTCDRLSIVFQIFFKNLSFGKKFALPALFYLFFEHSAPPTASEFNNDILSLSKMHNLVRHIFRKILTHGFSNEKFYKKSSKLNIYKSLLVRYNIFAVGGTNTTASRTTAIVFDKVSILWYV